MRTIISTIVCMLISYAVWAQSVCSISVVDGSTQVPISQAYVCTQHMATSHTAFYITNAQGRVQITAEPNTILSVSYVGYSTLLDTLRSVPAQHTIALRSSHFQFHEVVVTGQHKPVRADKSIYQIKLIGQREIAQKAASSLSDLLSHELTVGVSQDPATGSKIKMQGVSGQNVKILLDGVPVIGRMAGNIDLSQIDMTQVDHIEVVEGPMSVVYGSNALAGVINIISKQNKYAKLKAGVQTHMESVGIYNVDAHAAFRHAKHSFMLAAGRHFFDGYDTQPSTRLQDYKPKEQYNAKLNYAWAHQQWNVQWNNNIFSEKLLDRSNLIRTPYSIRGYDTWFYTLRANSSLQLKKQIDKQSAVDVLAAYSYYKRRKKRLIKDMTQLQTALSSVPSDHDTTRFDAVVLRASYQWQAPSELLSLQAGLDLNYESGEGKRMKNHEEHIADYAAFVSLKWQPSKAWSFQPALRAAYNTKYEAPLVPSFNVKYEWQQWQLRASYARGFRAPSLKELYLYFFDSNHQIEGNDALKAEYSHNVNMSSVYTLGTDKHQVKLLLKGFYNNIDNMITLVQVDPDNDLHYTNENVGHFESYGGELDVEYVLASALKLQAGIARLGRTDAQFSKQFVYHNNFIGNASLNLWKHTATLAVFYKWYGKYPFYTNYNNQLKVNYLEAYQNMDVSFSKHLWNRRLSLSCGVKNIFDNTIIKGGASTTGAHGSSSAVSALAGWGRTWFFGAKFNITVL